MPVGEIRPCTISIVLVEKTKDHGFKLIKAMNDYDLRETYGLSQTLYHLLNDFLQQLDDEFDVRKSKTGLIIESRRFQYK